MIDTFSKYSGEYDSWFERNFFAYQAELKLIKALLPRRGIGLEVGVGTGRFAAPLKIKYGIDPALPMLKVAAKAGIIVQKAKAEKIPYSSCCFDYVLLVTTLCFLDKADKAFSEISRVLKPKGKLIIGFVDKNSFLGKLYLKKRNKSKFYGQAKFYSFKDVQNILNKNGFRLQKVKQTIFSDPEEINYPESIKNGYGQGAFIGIQAERNK